MPATLSTTELRSMSVEELRRELRDHRHRVAKVRIDIELKKEKDSAKHRRERRAVARIKTILDEKIKAQPASMKNEEKESAKQQLKTPRKPRTVRAPKKSPSKS